MRPEPHNGAEKGDANPQFGQVALKTKQRVSHNVIVCRSRCQCLILAKSWRRHLNAERLCWSLECHQFIYLNIYHVSYSRLVRQRVLSDISSKVPITSSSHFSRTRAIYEHFLRLEIEKFARETRDIESRAGPASANAA